jgi:hypothetical protein
VKVDFSYPGLARVTVSVRWRQPRNQAQELQLRATLALER